MAARAPYQGVIQILSYNRVFYAATAACIASAMVGALFADGLLRLGILTAVVTALGWTVVSLAVSHYVYDRSPLYGLSWLALRPKVWANIHAGLDETSETLQARLPGSESFIWDVFDAEQMTEPSIAQARACPRSAGSRAASWRNLPVKTETLDAVFLMFVAHEFRRADARHGFFREVARVLKNGGSVLVLEHLRDLPNFLAYGPGFFHFQSRATWEAAFQAAELTLRSDQRITRFVHAFELAKSPQGNA